MPRARIAARSAGGRYSAPTSAFDRLEMSACISSAFSTMSLRNDGVPAKAVTRRSRIAATCISVCPVPPGTTVQPTARAPASTMEAAGVKW